MSASNATSAAKARKLDNQAKALELRRAGLGYTEIAAKIGVGKSQAQRYVVAGLAEVSAQIVGQADQLRAEELSRLDGMMTAIWPKARKGEYAAIDRALKIGERRAKLLGIEAPVRIETTGRDGAPIEVSSSVTIDPSRLSTATLRELLDARVTADRG